jgi:hypothetical protein
MKQLALVKLFQWYAMFCYWQYIVLALAVTLFQTSDASSAGFREANPINGQIGGFYNFVAFIGAFAMVPYPGQLPRPLPSSAGSRGRKPASEQRSGSVPGLRA